MNNKLKTALLSLFVCLLILFTMPISAFAEGSSSAAVSIGSASGKAGDTVVVSVNLNQNPGLIAMSLDVNFDAKQLELVSVSDSKILNNSYFSNDYSGNSYRLYWEDGLSTTNNNATGTIATMTFRLKEDCDKATVTVSGTGHNADVQAVSVNGTSGTITNSSPKVTTTAASTTKAPSTTAKPSTTKPSTTKPATTTKKATTTAAFTLSTNPGNTYPVDYEPTTEEATTDSVLELWDITTEEATTMTEIAESTTELVEEQEHEKLPRTKLILIVLIICFAIVGVAVIVSMLKKGRR